MLTYLFYINNLRKTESWSFEADFLLGISQLFHDMWWVLWLHDVWTLYRVWINGILWFIKSPVMIICWPNEYTLYTSELAQDNPAGLWENPCVKDTMLKLKNRHLLLKRNLLLFQICYSLSHALMYKCHDLICSGEGRGCSNHMH